MRFLIANDDGIYSPGLSALAEVASELGEVRIFAPDVEQSSAGHAVTHSRPLSIRRTPVKNFEAYRVNGTPADCVALGLHMWGQVDVVLSGINLGPNLGNAMWHSGTLAAAKQGTLLGVRSVAFSTPTRGVEPNFPRLGPYVREALELIIAQEELRLVNVNLPSDPKGLTWTRQAVRHYDGNVVPSEDPMGRKIFWLTVRPIEEAEDGTDLWAVRNGLVSMTPLELDLTDIEALERVKGASRIP